MLSEEENSNKQNSAQQNKGAPRIVMKSSNWSFMMAA